MKMSKMEGIEFYFQEKKNRVHYELECLQDIPMQVGVALYFVGAIRQEGTVHRGEGSGLQDGRVVIRLSCF